MTNRDVKVSVCMITYNHEKYISRAIESVINQKVNFPFELVIGDDCSSDNTKNICFEYYSKYNSIIRLRSSALNMGVIANFTENLKACKGEYIALLDGDDYWIDPYKLQKQVDYLETNPNVSVVATNYIVFNELTKQKRKISTPKKINYEILLKKKNIIATLTTCMRSEYVFEYLQEIGTYSKNWPVGDYPLWLYMSLKGDIGTIKCFTAVYLKRQQSICHYSDSKKQFSFYLRVIEIASFFANKFGASISAQKHIVRNKIETLINYGYSVKKAKLMRKWIIYYVYNQKKLPIKGIIKFCMLFFRFYRC